MQTQFTEVNVKAHREPDVQMKISEELQHMLKHHGVKDHPFNTEDEQKIREQFGQVEWVTTAVKMTVMPTPRDIVEIGQFAWAMYVFNPDIGGGFREIIAGEVPQYILIKLPNNKVHAIPLETFKELQGEKWWWDMNLFKPTIKPGYLVDGEWLGEIKGGLLLTHGTKAPGDQLNK